jgi:hypothetical protein
MTGPSLPVDSEQDMERRNFEESLQALVQQTPFHPFVVELVNGTRIKVQHSEALILHGRLAVFLDPAGGIKLFDHEGVNQLLRRTREPRRDS